MSVYVWAAAGGFALFLAIASMIYAFRRNKYPYEAIVLAKVGNSTTWFTDKFRVYKTEGKFYALSFEHSRDVEITSPPYEQWAQVDTKFKAANKLLSSEADPSSNKYTEKDIQRFVARGCVFYKTNEGFMAPIDVELSDEELDKIKLHTYDNNNRAFLSSEYKNEAEMRNDKWSKMLPYAIGALTIIVCVGAVVFVFIYGSNTFTESIATVCGDVSRSSVDFLRDQAGGAAA